MTFPKRVFIGIGPGLPLGASRTAARADTPDIEAPRAPLVEQQKVPPVARQSPLRLALMAALAAASLTAPVRAETIITITSAPLSATAQPMAPAPVAEAPGMFTRLLMAIGLAPDISLRPLARPESMAARPDRTAPVAADIATVIRNGQRPTQVTPSHRLPTGPDRSALLEAMPLPPEALARLR